MMLGMAGMYLGQNQPWIEDKPYIKDFSVHDNLLENMGCYGLTLKGVHESSGVMKIYTNTVRSTGVNCSTEPIGASFRQGIGTTYYEGNTYAEVYGNRVEHTAAQGISVKYAAHKVYDNLILGCGTEDYEKWKHGITTYSVENAEIYDNIIIQPGGYGIYTLGDCANITLSRNLVGDAGNLEGWADKYPGDIILGTGADANIYHPDVADFGFNTWSDDGDYSNDDFTFGGTPTCQSQGHQCCSSCESGSHPEYDADCSPQVCCEVCFTGTGSLIPQTSWTLKYVDSEELDGELRPATDSFDGNPATYWHTLWFESPHPHEIQIDLGNNYDVNGFRYLPRQDGSWNGDINEYEFYVSSNGVNWGTAMATGNFINDKTEKEILFTSKTGRYVRLVALSEVNGNDWTSMAELNVLGELAGGLCSDADTNSDNEVDIIEIMDYMASWKAGSVTIENLMIGIGEWKNGC